MSAMEISQLREDEVDSFIDTLWVPAQREMAAISEYTLADNIRDDGLSYRRSRLSGDESVTYLARADDQLVGYVSGEIQTLPPIFEQLRECHINELFVRDTYRRQGIASELLVTIEDWAQENECIRLDLNVHTENESAKALYEAEGYEISRYNMKKDFSNTN